MRSIIFTSLIAMTLGTAVSAGAYLEPGCYSRTYSKAHLAKNKDQVVAEIRLLKGDLGAQTQYGDEFAFLRVKFAHQGHVLRNGWQGAVLDQVLYCIEEEEGQTTCGVECDGGYFDVEKVGPNGVVISTEFLLMGDDGQCGGVVDLAETPQQKVRYLLKPAPASTCAGMGH